MESANPTSGERVERPFVSITWQRGITTEAGVNGCRVEDVLGLVTEKLHAYQAGPLACKENAEALAALESAQSALEARRQRRRKQGVSDTLTPHESERTEDVDEDFSATGA